MKEGIEYFPLQVTLDDKFELIEAEFGLTGFAVVVKLLQKIYGGFGYYCEWTDEVALLFAKRIGLGGNAVSEIIEASVRRGIFDNDLYDKYHILTSSGIQKRYFEAVSRRKQIEVDQRYLLVKVCHFCKNVDIIYKNVDISSENVNIFKQSKVKESKVKESKENGIREKSRTSRFSPPSVSDVEEYCKERGNDIDAESFVSYYESKGWLVGKSPMKDWKAAIRTWEKNDIKSGRKKNVPNSADIGGLEL